MNQNISNELDVWQQRFTPQLDGTWNLEEQKDGYFHHAKAHPKNEININRFEFHVKGVEFTKLESAFSSLKNQSLTDPNFESKEIQNDGNIAITYGKGKSQIAGVEPRDFVIATKVYKLGQGETLIVNQSVLHEAHPAIAGIQRAEMLFNILYLKQTNVNEVTLLNISHIDPKGDTPKVHVNKGAAQYAQSIEKLIEYARTH